MTNEYRMGMYIKKYGQGKISVVMVHGGPSLYGYMSSLGGLLENDFQVIDYAQRGTFENPSDLEQITIENHVDDIKYVVQSSETERTVLLGHSWGAALALLFAAKYPGLVDKVIVLGLSPLDRKIADLFGSALSRRLSAEKREQAENLDQLFQKSQSAEERKELKQKRLEIMTPLYNFTPNSTEALSEANWNFETFKVSIDALWKLIDKGTIENTLAAISDPVEAFHGEYDPIPCEATLEFLKENVQQCAVHSFAQAGHFIWVEPAAKDAFLQKLKASILN